MAEQSTFEAFLRDHATSLLRTSYLLTGDVGAAEDLLQETMAGLYPKWERVDGAQAPMAYVRRCLMNEYLNARRRRVVSLVDYDVTEASDPAPDVADEVADHDETMHLLATLNGRQRAAVVLRYFHGLTDKEIAGALDCRESTVRSLIHRALAAMRTTLADQAPTTAIRRRAV